MKYLHCIKQKGWEIMKILIWIVSLLRKEVFLRNGFWKILLLLCVFIACFSKCWLPSSVSIRFHKFYNTYQIIYVFEVEIPFLKFNFFHSTKSSYFFHLFLIALKIFPTYTERIKIKVQKKTVNHEGPKIVSCGTPNDNPFIKFEFKSTMIEYFDLALEIN